MGINSDILFFGGTFDPIHNGHILISQNVATEVQGINKIVLIPNGRPPHKTNKIVAEHRLRMCEIVASQNNIFSVEDFEVKKEEKSYTIETLYYLKDKYKINGRINFLIGEDTFYELGKWHKIEDVFKMTTIFISLEKQKLDGKFYDMRNKLEMNYKETPLFYFIPTPIIEIRSTAIRHKIKNKMSIYGATPCKVIEYIKYNKLYED